MKNGAWSVAFVFGSTRVKESERHNPPSPVSSWLHPHTTGSPSPPVTHTQINTQSAIPSLFSCTHTLCVSLSHTHTCWRRRKRGARRMTERSRASGLLFKRRNGGKERAGAPLLTVRTFMEMNGLSSLIPGLPGLLGLSGVLENMLCESVRVRFAELVQWECMWTHQRLYYTTWVWMLTGYLLLLITKVHGGAFPAGQRLHGQLLQSEAAKWGVGWQMVDKVSKVHL